MKLRIGLRHNELIIEWERITTFEIGGTSAAASQIREIIVDLFPPDARSISFVSIPPDAVPGGTSTSEITINYIDDQTLEMLEHTIHVRREHPERDKYSRAELKRQ